MPYHSGLLALTEQAGRYGKAFLRLTRLNANWYQSKTPTPHTTPPIPTCLTGHDKVFAGVSRPCDRLRLVHYAGGLAPRGRGRYESDWEGDGVPRRPGGRCRVLKL